MDTRNPSVPRLRGRDLLAKLERLALLADELPDGAEITVAWVDAAPDLLLLLALQPGGMHRVCNALGGDVHQAEWMYGRVVIRAARRVAHPSTGAAA